MKVLAAIVEIDPTRKYCNTVPRHFRILAKMAGSRDVFVKGRINNAAM